MIAFEDFVPEKGGFFHRPTVKQVAEPLQRANEWIERNGIDVINVETLVHYTAFIRVWHRSD